MPPSEKIAVLILGVLVLESPWNAHHSPCLAIALQIQQAFASPNQTNNFVVDEVSRKVYLATVNTVYQLNGTLSVEVEKRTGPVEDNLLCHAPQLPQAPCEHPKSLTDNFNKLLELDREQGVLVVCGSVYQGFCELRKMENISEIAVEFPPHGEKTVFPSMLNIAANHPNASTVGLIFRSHGGNTRLLVGATYTGAGTQFFPKNHSKEDLRFENTPEIAIRSLNINDLSRLFTYDINPSEDNVFKIKQEVKQKNKLHFVHAFIQKSYAYIAINNDANMGHKQSQPNSILARICLDTENTRKSTSESRKLTESFIQMPLQCGYNGNIYNRLVSVHPAEIHSGTGEGLESHLFGVFTKSDRKSALCAFRFSDIEEEIRQGRRNCSNSPSSDVQVLDSVIQGSGAACVHKGNLVLQPEQLDCGAAHLQHPLALRRPLRATPLFESLGLSSVAVDNIHNHTVVFLGTSTGRLRKNLTVANQWALKLPAGESVHHIMTFDPMDRNYLYLMTSHHLLRVKVAACGQYRTCSDCLGAGDAHCGWCTLESRCSIQRECSWGLQARSWIGMGEGPQQCPSMTLTPQEISLSDVGILINGSVPDLVGSRVECDYGLGVATVATVHLDYGPAQIQTCPLLPRERYPHIPPGRDHLMVPVAIKVNGTSVVSGTFIIYDCERTGAIHPKTACISCLSTRWRCYWDQNRHSCLSTKDDSKPSLLEVSYPSVLNHSNQTYCLCILAERIHVNKALPFVPSLSLSLSVEVYNCGVGSGDCSQCLGREDQGHLCGWCDNICRPRDDCQYMSSQCPDPEITKISPLSGPLEGGTLLTVQGRNMGRRADVVKVSIGMVPCKILPYQYTVSVHFMSSGICIRTSPPAQPSHTQPYGAIPSLVPGPVSGSVLSLWYLPHVSKRHITRTTIEPVAVFWGGLAQKGPSDLELAPEEYSVMIGSYPCDISFHNNQLFHCTINGSLGSSEGELPVTVSTTTLYSKAIHLDHFIIMILNQSLVVYCTKSRRAERYWQKTLLQMEEMESQIRDEIRKGFAELQTDMTDLTKELNRSQGIPFLEYKQFVTRTFFPKMCSDYERSLVQPVYENDALGPRALPETHPLLQDWQPSNTAKPNMEEGITLFSTLLNNKHFLVTFVHALEQQKDFAIRDRCSLASLLTIALHGKLEYYTSIMKDLLVDLIDASAAKNPKLMLRRTESVVEKMLTNWMSICMYSYLKETVGEPFFLLLCAIRQQINKGSIDAITGKARYTLNEEWLLRENVEAKPQNINVSFQGCGMDSLVVKVVNTDTICQVKEKILEAFYKNLPFSQWPRAEDVDLEWFASGSNSRILQDLDNTSVMEDGRKKLNTVTHYQIPEGASFAMSMKDKRDNTLGRGRSHTHTLSPCHTPLHVLPHDEPFENKKSHRQSHRKKVLPEIYLTRLLSTKGTLQKFLDDLFQAILSIPAERPPLAIKYFFDFLEEQADKRGITDPDTLHIWKTNCLPLRFWVNILKNPQFVFDIEKTDHMDACLSVIAQAFIDACSVSDLQLGKDSPTNKLLYAKEIPEYKKRVQCYYKQIHEMAPLSEQEMNAHLAEESRKYRNEFNTNLALTEIYKYAKKYRNQVVSALESNPTAKRSQLHHKFEQVIALVEDNIYECSSEA
uniref:Plexin D1 n=1 Tax=Hucho hucho TaxID=62062 RepID=A0A4W5LIH2_9TELE